jgi:hypothetical protein
MRKRLAGTFFQGFNIEVSLFEAIKPVEDPVLGVGSKRKTSGNLISGKLSLCSGI